MSKMDGPGIAAVAVGIVFLYGGIKGYSPLVAFQNLIQGKNPNEGQANANPLVASDPNTPNSGIGVSGSVTASGAQGIAQSSECFHSDAVLGRRESSARAATARRRAYPCCSPMWCGFRGSCQSELLFRQRFR